jgi:hypothetical protein
VASFGEQIEASRQSHLAVRALEESVRLQVEAAFLDWENGDETNQSIRWRLERIVRDAYRSAAAVGVAHTSAQSGIPGWRPVGVFNTDYLQGLLADVRRNLRDYKKSSRDAVARRRAVSRIEHSAGVGATRGYTDATLETNRELRDFGYMVRKLWLANFVNNVPCEFCQALHGEEVGLDEDFPTDSNLLKVYGDLKGPPRHPRCKCRLVILHVRLENLFERLNVEDPRDGTTNTMSTSEIQALPKGVFGTITRGLRKVIRFLRGGTA